MLTADEMSAHDKWHKAGYEDGYRAGQEEMRRNARQYLEEYAEKMSERDGGSTLALQAILHSQKVGALPILDLGSK